MRRLRARLAAAVVAVAACAAVGAPRAARAASCSFVSVTGVNFGAYDVFDPTPNDSAGGVSYSCTGGATVAMTLSMGNAPTFNPRQLFKSGGATIDYNLYLDASRATIWGDGAATGQYGPFAPADGATVSVPIFGRIPAGQDASVGMYADTVTITINF